MLETERYGEAGELLEFLLGCQGQDSRQYEEWNALLQWLKDAFPTSLDGTSEGSSEPDSEEDLARQHIESKLALDKDYGHKLLHAAMEGPLSEHSLLALEQLSYVDMPEIDDALREWLQREQLHPLVQYHVLQTLKRRGATGSVKFFRGQEAVDIELDTTPLKSADFPPPIHHILDRVAEQTQVHNPNLFYFAQELWFQFVMGTYGTMDYRSMLSDEDSTLDIWAAALHQTVSESLPDGKSDEEIRSTYGITDALRLRFEQVYRSMKQFVGAVRQR
ncbi:hypothetical protein J2Z69_001458 [Paenibacillus shirakamiensis]|uniref:Uncharacterized protein n=1 Tax=Paenibacillus shirakamiensis TaxID=1265935 RepID=A0ABS4JFD9_9BACL|nr:hypothetical protein [Paenibacillus shirakamiensis]MBP2000427.1 hypothetical protein [Paenibacillus shirakamiensis]